MFQPRVGVAWDVRGNGRSVVRGQRRRLLRAPEHAEPGRLGHDQRPAAADDLREHRALTAFGAPTPAWPGVLTPDAASPAGSSRCSPASACSIATTRTRASTPFNVGYEQELVPDVAGYVDFTLAEGRDLTRFLNYNRSGPSCCDAGPDTGNTYVYSGTPVRAAARRGDGDHQPRQVALSRRDARRRASASRSGYQFEANYVLAKDEDDDSNERDPFTDRSFNFFDLTSDYGPSDRDIRHKVQLLRLLRAAAGACSSTPASRPQRAADHAVAARAERRRSRPQQRSQGQRVLHVRLAAARGRSRSAARSRSCRASRCSTPSTTPTTSTR